MKTENKENFVFSLEQLIAKEILELAGYNIKVFPTSESKLTSYQILDGKKSIRGYSSIEAFLKPQRVVDEIKELSQEKGFREGYSHFKNMLNKLLGTDEIFKVKK